jgi:hypothetical protein
MSRISITLAATLALSTFVSACGSKKEGEKASGGGGGGAAVAVKLPKLGLVLDAPGEVTVGDAIVGDGHMLQGEGIGAMSVEVAKSPQTVDEAKEDAKMYTPKNLKADTLPDGWVLTFENKGAAGSNFWVDVRRTIDGKLVKCSTTGSDGGQAAAVLTACKSLRKG